MEKLEDVYARRRTVKKFCFTVDDNIRFLKELTARRFEGLFEHPYLNTYKRLHERFGLKVQLNLFYESEDFNLSDMTDKYKAEWQANSDWLKMSFHSRTENERPYEFADYAEVYRDCQNVKREIVRFASPFSLGKTTTVHYCLATCEGLKALKHNGVEGLLGLYGAEESPRSSYQNTEEESAVIRDGGIVYKDETAYAGIDVVLNNYSQSDILRRLNLLKERDFIKVMIHEQYFYPDYPRYQSDFEDKLFATFAFLTGNGFVSRFFEECIKIEPPKKRNSPSRTEKV